MTKRFCLFILSLAALLCSMVNGAYAGGGDDDTTAPEPIGCGSAIMNAADPAVALENTARLHPDVYQRIMHPPSSPTPLMKTATGVGDQWTFNVYNQATNSYDQVTGVLQFAGKYARIWVDQNATNVTPAVVLQLAHALDTATVTGSRNPDQCIIQNDVDVFGPIPLNTWKSDHMTEFLLTDIQDNIAGAAILGFFYQVDQDTRSSVSNHMNILYIDSKEGLQGGVNSLLSTVAHEFQHLLHYARNKNSETMYNEGCSEDASILNGYMDRANSNFMANTNVDLFRWSNGSSQVLADYERAMTFMHYLQEQFGEQFLYQLVGEPSTGMTRIDKTLAKIGSSSNYKTILENFAIANFLRKNSDLVYNYELPIKSGGTPRIQKSFILPNYAADTTYSLQRLGAMYVGYNNPSKLAEGVTVHVSAPSSFTLMVVLYRNSEVEVRRLGGTGDYTISDWRPYDKFVFVIVNTSTSTQSVKFTTQRIALGVENQTLAPAADLALKAMPNPFMGSTMLHFTTTESGPVSLKIFDATGEQVASLVDGDRFEVGEHDLVFEPGDLPNGYYVARLVQGDRTATQSMILLK